MHFLWRKFTVDLQSPLFKESILIHCQNLNSKIFVSPATGTHHNDITCRSLSADKKAFFECGAFQYFVPILHIAVLGLVFFPNANLWKPEAWQIFIQHNIPTRNTTNTYLYLHSQTSPASLRRRADPHHLQAFEQASKGKRFRLSLS